MALPNLTRQVGPLPLWGYGAIAGGVFFLLMGRHGSPIAAAALNPAVTTPAAPGDATAGLATGGNTGGSAPSSPYPPQTVGVGQTVYDPTTGSTTKPVTISDLLGGQSVSSLIASLGPNYQSFNLAAGDASVGTTNSAQNAIDEALAATRDNNATSASIANNTNFYNAANVHDTNYYAAAIANNTNFYDYLTAGLNGQQIDPYGPPGLPGSPAPTTPTSTSPPLNGIPVYANPRPTSPPLNGIPIYATHHPYNPLTAFFGR